MSEPVTLYSRPERLTIAKIRKPLSTAAANLLAKATEMVACAQAPDVDDALDTLRLAGDKDYVAVAAENNTVAITKAAPAAPSAFDAMTTVAKAMVARGQARDVASAVDVLRAQRHPAYTAWMGTTAPAPTPVHKAAPVPTHIQKRQEVETEINKRAAPLMRTGLSETEAWTEVFKQDRARGGDLYERYRKAGYSRGPLFPDATPAPAAVPDQPAYALAKQLARTMKADDPYGQHSGASEIAMVNKVWEQHPELYTQYLQEVRARR